ncbi:MAG: EpsG family protein [Lachnospiraceae bacterium]|nr:EpsG family protein [Lachnospiraceae bacterium]
MLIYLITFFGSYCLLVYAEKVKTKRMHVFISLIAILIPSILAGLRDYSIGTDIEVYGNIWFRNAVDAASSNNIRGYIQRAVNSDIGALYALLNYIVAKCTSNAHWFYFVLSFLTTGLVYKAASDNDDIVNAPFAMLVYYFLFYNQSLNILRQGLALVFVLCSFKSIRDGKIIKFIVWTLLGYMVHLTAIVGVVLLIVYKVVNSKLKVYAKGAILVATIVVVAEFSYVLNFLIGLGILSSKYEMYGTTFQRGGGYIRLFFLCLPNLILLFLLIKKNIAKKETEALKFYVVIATAISFLAFRMTYITRMALYFDMLLVISIPLTCDNMKYKIVNNKSNMNRWGVIAYLLFYWIFVYVHRNSGETVPYMFFW